LTKLQDELENGHFRARVEPWNEENKDKLAKA
jgi:hypothetical protein